MDRLGDGPWSLGSPGAVVPVLAAHSGHLGGGSGPLVKSLWAALGLKRRAPASPDSGQ